MKRRTIAKSQAQLAMQECCECDSRHSIHSIPLCFEGHPLNIADRLEILCQEGNGLKRVLLELSPVL